jgi:4-alpha-glucanotransferase
MGTLTTHDLPTVAGALSDTDPAADPTIVDRMYAFAERGEAEDHNEVSVAAHRRLGRAGSELVMATLEDLVGSRLRVNLPGTVDQYPNWRLPLPVGVDELDDHPLPGRIVAAISEARSSRA